jgi:hypothetical protein
VEQDKQDRQLAGGEVEKDTSWRWMVAIGVVVGLVAWLTR